MNALMGWAGFLAAMLWIYLAAVLFAPEKFS